MASGRIRQELREVAKLIGPDVKLIFVRSYMAEGGGEFIDDAWHEAEEKLEKTGKDPSTQDFIIVTSHKLRMYPTTKEIALQHNLLLKGSKERVKAAFRKVFGKRFKWDGKNMHTMVVKAGKSRAGPVPSRPTRPSPQQSATEFPVGRRVRGQDGNMWKVASVKGGVHRWVPCPKST